MQFDDRLDTVLRSRATGDLARRTQYRQLVDLVGTPREDRAGAQMEEAYARLAELEAHIPAATRAGLLRDPALRIASPRLAARLAEQEPAVAAAAMARATLREGDWLELIPQLPIAARGYLRHRDDLPGTAEALLRRLGVLDLVLPQPDIVPLPGDDAQDEPLELVDIAPAAQDDANEPVDTEEPVVESEIGALVQRIEAFQKARRQPVSEAAPRLPLNDAAHGEDAPDAIDFECDPSGTIVWAEADHAPMLVGTRLGGPVIDGAMTRRVPLAGIPLTLDGAAAIKGDWRIDAAPYFHKTTGGFAGYYGRLRREPAEDDDRPVNTAADRIRQLLHELRTPVNAIQGFAEVIQQQVFGPSPNEYRALAANIAGDAARILAGFEELDRLARLETGALELGDDESDLAAIFARTARQVAPSLSTRSARLSYEGDAQGAPVAYGRDDAERLAWRLVATLGAAMAPGEAATMQRVDDPKRFVLACDLPATLGDRDDIFASGAGGTSGALSAGLFGTGFALRLARAEARAIGGDLARIDETLVLSVPLLTAAGAGHSENAEQAERA